MSIGFDYGSTIYDPDSGSIDVPTGASLLSNSELLLQLIKEFEWPDIRVFLRVFIKARNAWLTPLALPEDAQCAGRGSNDSLHFVDFTGPFSFAIAIHTKLFVLQLSEKLDKLSILRQIDCTDGRYEICNIARVGDDRWLVLQHNASDHDKQVQQRVNVLRRETSNEETVLTRGTFNLSKFHKVGWHNEIVYILSTQDDNETGSYMKLYYYDTKKRVFARAPNFESLREGDDFFENCDFAFFESCLYAFNESVSACIYVFDLPTLVWLPDPLVLQCTSTRRVVGMRILPNGEAILQTCAIDEDSSDDAVLTTYFSVPRLSELAVRELHRHMPRETKQKLQKSNVLSAIELVTFLLNDSPSGDRSIHSET